MNVATASFVLCCCRSSLIPALELVQYTFSMYRRFLLRVLH